MTVTFCDGMLISLVAHHYYIKVVIHQSNENSMGENSPNHHLLKLIYSKRHPFSCQKRLKNITPFGQVRMMPDVHMQISIAISHRVILALGVTLIIGVIYSS